MSKQRKLKMRVTEGYTYDPLYQLTQVVQGATTTESYSYDFVGNRLSSVGVPLYSYNTSNELTSNSTGSYTYDNNGNTLTDPSGKSYTWDFENRLTQVVVPGTGTVTFKYDPFGRRVQKSSPSGTVNYLYIGANILEEVDASGNALARYTHSGAVADEPLAELRSGSTSYYELDGLGSVTSLSNTGGTVANSYTYDSYGKLTASTGTLANPFQYTGREFDQETGLRYYRARYYNSSGGRFTSEDPIGFLGSGTNFYRYVNNSPLNSGDPSGKSAVVVLPIVVEFPVVVPIVVSGGLGWVTGRAIGNMPIGNGQTVDDAVTNAMTAMILYSRGNNDPFRFKPFNPGRKPCRECNPCPPPSPTWTHDGNAHGSTLGFHLHWIGWNQSPDCTCRPKRMSGGE